MWARKNYMDAWGEKTPPENNLIPVFVLPADAKSYDTMVARIAEALAIDNGHPWGGCGDSPRHVWRNAARAVLAALNINRPKVPATRKK